MAARARASSISGPRETRAKEAASRLSAIGRASISPSVLRSSGTSAMRAAPDLAAAGEEGTPAAGADADLALDAAQDAEEREQQLLLALAVEAAEADDLAAADRRGRRR